MQLRTYEMEALNIEKHELFSYGCRFETFNKLFKVKRINFLPKWYQTIQQQQKNEPHIRGHR